MPVSGNYFFLAAKMYHIAVPRYDDAISNQRVSCVSECMLTLKIQKIIPPEIYYYDIACMHQAIDNYI